MHGWADETSVWREQGSVRLEGSVLGTRVCASLSVCTALGKGQVTPEGERRKRKRSVNVLYSPVHKAPAVPVPSNKSLFRKNVKASLGGGKIIKN